MQLCNHKLYNFYYKIYGSVKSMLIHETAASQQAEVDMIRSSVLLHIQGLDTK